MFKLVLVDTCLGWMGIIGSTRGVRNILLPHKSRKQVIDLAKLDYVFTCDNTSLCEEDLPLRLQLYLKGRVVEFHDKLDLGRTTLFQQKVWQVTRNIAYGHTQTYGWVAERVGCASGARAVGQALGKNPLPIIIPCHRIIACDGTLGGFSAGLPLKKHFLELERAI